MRFAFKLRERKATLNCRAGLSPDPILTDRVWL